MMSGWALLWLGGSHLAFFLIGLLVVDGALQALHISNQSVVYSLNAEARSRLNAVYMTGYFTGAAIGSALGSLAWTLGGWMGTSLAGLTLGCCTLLAVLWDRKLARQQALAVISR